MAEGCYDLDGKCVNCGRYHPCNCEINKDIAESRMEKKMESQELEARGYREDELY